MLHFIIFLVFLAIIYFVYTFEKDARKKTPLERKQQMFELLKNKYNGLKENDLNFFEYNTNNHTILFEYKLIASRRVSNNLKVYLDITAIEEDIKQLCKIHFYCTKIDNRDYVEMPVDVYYDTLYNLSEHSTKIVKRIIAETESYISEKRTKRDRK